MLPNWYVTYIFFTEQLPECYESNRMLKRQHAGHSGNDSFHHYFGLVRDCPQKAPGCLRNPTHLVHCTVEFSSFLSSKLKHPLSPVSAFFSQGPGHSLGSQGKGSTGDRCGQVQPFGDLPPYLLVDDLHQATLLCHQLV